MEKVEINKDIKLSPHFTLGELTKTKHVTEDGNIPSHVEIENLKRICENWLEDLRYRYNRLYSRSEECGVRSDFLLAGVRPQSKVDAVVDAGVRFCFNLQIKETKNRTY